MMLPRFGTDDDLRIEAELVKVRAHENPCDLVAVWLPGSRVMWLGLLLQGDLACSVIHPLRDASECADVAGIWNVLVQLGLLHASGASAAIADDLLQRLRVQTSVLTPRAAQ